jgi:hypothetical protein
VVTGPESAEVGEVSSGLTIPAPGVEVPEDVFGLVVTGADGADAAEVLLALVVIGLEGSAAGNWSRDEAVVKVPTPVALRPSPCTLYFTW